MTLTRSVVWLACLLMPFPAPAQTQRVQGGEVMVATIVREKTDSVYAAYLARLRSEGRTAISVMVMAVSTGVQSTESLMRALTARGGLAQVRAEEIGYVRVLLPLDAVQTLRSVHGLADYAIAEAPGWEGPRDSPVRSSSLPRAAPDSAYQAIGARADPPLLTANQLMQPNPFIPLDEIAADALARRVPDADGRGVTIGIVENSVDYTHPALRVARSHAGEVVPKIAGVLDSRWLATRSADNSEVDRSAVVLRSTVATADGSVVVDGMRIQLPSAGDWRLGTWARTDPYRRTNKSVTLDVAWRDTTQVWVDLDRNGQFGDNEVFPNINVRFGAGTLPIDSANGFDVAHSFAIAFDPRQQPHLYSAYRGSHTTMVAATATGSSFLTGSAGGVAPGARVIPIHIGEPLSGIIEAFLIGARDPRIDILTSQTGGLTSFPFIGSSFPGILLERIARHYGKPIFIAAANQGPALGTVGQASLVPSVISVGAYISQRSYEANEGWRVPDRDNVAIYSGRGPATDGAMKPDIVAPTHMVTAATCGDERASASVMMYRLPPCYILGSGTSNATPFAAGAAALLLSAARLHGLSTDPNAISWALLASARHLQSLGVYEQGAGLIQVDSAWSLLRSIRLGMTGNASASFPLYDIAITAPVENAYAAYLADSTGNGLYLREGWRAGRRGTRTITMTRTSGPGTPVTYRLQWRGNDGTFGLRTSSVSLPLNRPVRVAIDVAPATEGIHSAALELVDPATHVAVRRALVTVIAAIPLSNETQFTAQRQGALTRPHTTSYFVEVPAGMKELRISWLTQGGDPILKIRSPRANNLGGVPAIGETPNLSEPRRIITVEDPTPGTWEFVLTHGSNRSRGRARQSTGIEESFTYELLLKAVP
jgi:subtilisin family serine protease